MPQVSCMGGGCRERRERCALYHAADRSTPVERLCEPGCADSFEPIRIVRAAGTWTASPQPRAPASVFSGALA